MKKISKDQSGVVSHVMVALIAVIVIGGVTIAGARVYQSQHAIKAKALTVGWQSWTLVGVSGDQTASSAKAYACRVSENTVKVHTTWGPEAVALVAGSNYTYGVSSISAFNGFYIPPGVDIKIPTWRADLLNRNVYETRMEKIYGFAKLLSSGADYTITAPDFLAPTVLGASTTRFASSTGAPVTAPTNTTTPANTTTPTTTTPPTNTTTPTPAPTPTPTPLFQPGQKQHLMTISYNVLTEAELVTTYRLTLDQLRGVTLPAYYTAQYHFNNLLIPNAPGTNGSLFEIPFDLISKCPII